jgi:hypothetical protein
METLRTSLNFSFLSAGEKRKSATPLPPAANRTSTGSTATRPERSQSECPPVPKINDTVPEEIFRAYLLVQYASQSKVLQTGSEYLRDLMTNKEHYTNVLVDVYFQELETDWQKFYQEHAEKFKQLAEYSQLIFDGQTHELDRHYLNISEYIPLRKEIERLFTVELSNFSHKYSLELRFKGIRDKLLIWESDSQAITSGSDIFKMIRKKIFYSLAKEYEAQLTTVQPYATHFANAKSRRKILERVIFGLSDYEFFTYRYDVAINQKTYLGAFSQLIDELVCRIASPNSSTAVQLVDNLWKLYTALLTAIEMTARLTKLYPTVIFRKPVGMEDPNIYFNFAHQPMRNLLNEIKEEPTTNFSPADSLAHLKYFESYGKACGQICTSIGLIVPLLSQLLDSQRIATPGSSSRGTGSSRGAGSSMIRRKITAPEVPREFGKTMTEIYANFALLSSSAKIQQEALESILKPNSAR